MFDTLEELEAAVDKLAVADVSGDDVVRLRWLLERVEFEWLRRVAELDRTGNWAARLSVAGWLRDRCRMTPGAARAAVQLARRLDDLPATAEAFGRGEMSRAHAMVLADVYTPERAEMLDELEPKLVGVARELCPRGFRRVVRHVVDSIDGDGGAAVANEQYARRWVSISRTLDGMVVLDGQLDPDSGEVVLTALEAWMHDDRTDRSCSVGERRADALVGVCRQAIAHSEAWLRGPGPRRRQRPHVSAVVDLELLREFPDPTDLLRLVRGEGAHAGQLPSETLRRLSCDAGIARVITDGRSEPLDVGRTTRTIPPAIWRALVVRDRHCTHPGCDKPPGWCEAHHRTHWADGGPTNLANLELLCWRHHRTRHEGARSKRERGP
jgi:hypothetical protein